MTEYDSQIDVSAIRGDQARAILTQYKFSNAKLAAHMKARTAYFANFPVDAQRAEIAANALALEVCRNCGIRDALDLATLRAAFTDMLFGVYAHSQGLITDDEYDLLTKAINGVLD